MISNAYAQTAGSSSGGLLLQPVLLALMVGLFYFLLIRPQQKRAKEQRTMMEALKEGDEVIAAGGLLGTVSKVADQYVTLAVAQAGQAPVEILVQKASVTAMLPKGTIKAL